ncbi:DsrE family protein [Arcanobacterium phocisimile]|uniref:DsrE family protein n=1 Tax=Arcanobacterium phocisimile TaxID=1302235 RepID=A0ABX7IG09_9ACTO|nr:DsrE family protein [Arcanobacterium phocisimile]QRV01987.1 DsrE family protein [Arcanobacterium phocisimile]
MSEIKLVFHVNENDRWPFAIRSVDNVLLNSDTPGTNITVVANGAAVRSFSQLDVEPHRMSRIKNLAEKGVHFLVCNIALEQRQIKPEMVPDFCAIVPAGIVEIAKLQAEGYGYVKP